MEEDNTVYFNDEWNLPKFEIDKDLEKRYIERLIKTLTGENDIKYTK